MGIALLVIDMQKAFVEDKQNEINYETALWVINHTTKLFRTNDKPVIMIRDIEDGNGPEYGYIEALDVENSDIHVTKVFNNSFWKTNLEKILKEKNIDTVVIAGNALEHCVTATYFGAKERGFRVLLLQQGIVADLPESLKKLYDVRPLVSYSALAAMFKSK